MLLEIKNVFKKVTEPSGEVITISHADNLTLDAGGQMLLTGHDCGAVIAQRRGDLF